MNSTDRQIILGQRRMVAAQDAAEAPALRDEPILRADLLRRGLAEIDSNEGDGAYKITELWWDPAAEEWTRAEAPLGFDNVEAADYMNNATGGAVQVVRFWEHRGLEGEIRLFIDVNGGWDGVQKVSVFTVHYSGTDTTSAFHCVPNCKNAMLEVGIDARRCSGHCLPTDHPGHTAMEVTGGLSNYGWCNALATWSGGDWRSLQYTSHLANGDAEADGVDAIADFHIQCRVTEEGDLEFRIQNNTGGPVSAVIMGAIRATLCLAPPGTAEIGNCCCHDDDWGTV